MCMGTWNSSTESLDGMIVESCREVEIHREYVVEDTWRNFGGFTPKFDHLDKRKLERKKGREVRQLVEYQKMWKEE